MAVAGREIGVGADRHRGDDGGLAGETLDQRRAAAGFRGILAGDEGDGVAWHGAKPPAQQIEARRKFRGQIDRVGVAGIRGWMRIRAGRRRRRSPQRRC